MASDDQPQNSPYRLVDLRYLDADVERVDVGSDIVIDLWPDGRIGFEHVCPGIWQDPQDGDGVQYLIAPIWPGQMTQREPLTLTPSLLCQGAANPCGLHGFVTEGVWRGC